MQVTVIPSSSPKTVLMLSLFHVLLVHCIVAWQGSDLTSVQTEEGNITTPLLMLSGTCCSSIAAVMQSTSRVSMEGR